MNNLEIVLEADSQGGAAVTVKDLVLSIGINQGNINIEGKQESVLSTGRVIENAIPLSAYSVRIAELEQLIPSLSGDAKAKAEAKKAIWTTFLDAVKAPLETALQAQYNLDNSIV